ncbi:hypothetical protein AB6A40_001208 [Gnathostoma spinigerum]|uniref:Activating signal cointegrator 1 complex subunit 3 n=1 Tax=Gnathostoma spinigerum TaxID=75299 RepID=A0ABD6E8K8_9BILA
MKSSPRQPSKPLIDMTPSEMQNGDMSRPKVKNFSRVEQHDQRSLFSECKIELKTSVKRSSTLFRYKLSELLDLLERIFIIQGSSRVHYSCLSALHNFVTDNLPSNTSESNVLNVISRIVGRERLTEIVEKYWSMIGTEHEFDDPPLYHGRKALAASNDRYLDVPQEIVNAVRQHFGVEVNSPAKQLDVNRFVVPSYVCWPNRNVENAEPEIQNNVIQSDHDIGSSATSYSHQECSSEPSVQQEKRITSLQDISCRLFGLFSEPESVIRIVLELLQSAHSDDQLQGELIDILGFEQFEFVGALLESRSLIKAELASHKCQENRTSEAIRARQVMPGYCQQVVVQSKLQSDVRKELRKEQKRAVKELNRITHAFGEKEKLEIELAQRDLLRQRQLELDGMGWSPSYHSQRVAAQREKYPYVFDSLAFGGQEIFLINGMKLCLPVGSKRVNERFYEEVTVPCNSESIPEEIKCLKIDDMDEICRLGFKDFKTLNIIQSVVYEQAYKTRENLLICAPTGAGKTNIAMLSILAVVQDFTDCGNIQKDEFKIIYIAPMKALAAEMTQTFSRRLKPLGLNVRELTGDTTLSKREISATQMLILTPEKWDVVTRKAGDNSLTSLVRLLIIDEVHLLHDDRGPVIETIVARTLRQVEMSQQSIRIVGLSATLPNYVDVANFLRVNPKRGMFFFDGRFRPVPLTQTFIGVRKPVGVPPKRVAAIMDEVCYEKVVGFVREGQQVLVFVHARNATGRLAASFRELAAAKGELSLFEANSSQDYNEAKKAVKSTHNSQLMELFQFGFGIHHAGLPRQNRTVMEKVFSLGHISVLFCTSTLAWGVNLPAHAVVIRGTEVFDDSKGTFTDIGVLDVQQIFGRAGRPQYESSGHGVIITWQKSLSKYLAMLNRQAPIESQFMKRIYDNLNAEISLGTVSNISEAVEWLSYSYFFIRAKLNPLAYGIPFNQQEKDPELYEYLTAMMTDAAERLDMNQMIRYDSLNGYVAATDLGRIASYFYVKYETIERWNTSEAGIQLKSFMTDSNILDLIASASEFEQIKIREEDCEEVDEIAEYFCRCGAKSGSLATVAGKVNCLIQAYISRASVRSYSLRSELVYIEQNCGRLCRAMFEIVLRRGWAEAANAVLNLAKCIEKKMWPMETPVRQLADFVRCEWIEKIERKKLSLSQLYEMSAKELGNMLNCDGEQLYDALQMLPYMHLEASVRPITHTILQISVQLTPGFRWNDRLLGSQGAQSFWLFVENLNENLILHYERLIVLKKKVKLGEQQNLVFTVPIRDKELSHNYQVRVASDYFVVDDNVLPLSLHNCFLPSSLRPHTDLLDLDPLPVAALKNKNYESIYHYDFFNPIQSQVFHCLYKTDQNALIGAPTGSGKTLCAELAVYRLFTEHPNKKCVYIAPLKALVRERVRDWQEKFGDELHKRIVELTGDHTPDIRVLENADVVITTPEKWDGITRGWESRNYVKDVALIIIDEIHLLGVERGAVLEAIVTRLKIMMQKRKDSQESFVRLVGLSTALANAGDIAEWLHVKDSGLYNFRPNVRPVPVQVHIAGFPGQHYCPRMALMNRPAFKAIKSYSPCKPALIFVASRRQTRLTAMALVSQLVLEDDPKQWLHMDVKELETLVQTVGDENLKLTLPFGIGMHHAGLQRHERSIVEQLFVDRKIQVLVATATLAWGINMPAHLVIVKGTEYYDGKTHKYVDFPVTDVLQMMGRAGRPQYDDSAVAVIYVQDVKKNFYKRFLYEPFPVESSLLQVIPNHVNAEITAGTITNKHQMMEYISETYLYRRLFANPSYYGIAETTPEALVQFLVGLIDNCVDELILSNCITVDEDTQTLAPTPLGRIASVYYLRHETVRFLSATLRADSLVEDVLKILADCPEYDEIPVRHNEDVHNAQILKYLPIKLPHDAMMDSSHTKAHLLFQAHMSRFRLSTDYFTDQRSVLDQCIRIIEAMLDISMLCRWLSTALNIVALLQSIIQARWYTDNPLLVLPNLDEESSEHLLLDGTVPMLQHEFGLDEQCIAKNAMERGISRILEHTTLSESQAAETIEALMHWPIIRPRFCRLTQGDETVELNLLQDERRPHFTTVKSDSTYKISFGVEAIGPNRFDTAAYAPKFAKEKSAGWMLFLGEKDTNRLIAFSKIPYITGFKTLKVNMKAPQEKGRHIIHLFLLSDSYLGIDQEYSLHLEVV